MALSKITFVKGNGGLTRKNQSQDGISALLFYQTVPAAFATNAQQLIYSLAEAEGLGITESAESIAHYHVSEYFRINPAGSLWLAFYAAESGGTPVHDFVEVKTLQYAAEGNIKQVGIYTQIPFVIGMVTALQAVCTTLESEHMPLSAILCPNVHGLTLSGLPALKTSNAPSVTVIVGQDAGGIGAELYDIVDKTIGIVGAVLGCVAKASVSESIAWVSKFPVAGAELNTLGFGEGTDYTALTPAALDALDDKGYVFARKLTGLSGSFISGDWTASNEDYDTIAKNRAMNKAIREVRAALLPTLNSPVKVNGDGTLQETDVQTWQAIAGRPLAFMEAASEISAYEVFVDPDQNVLSDDELEIVVQIVPVGTARFITVKIGFSISVA